MDYQDRFNLTAKNFGRRIVVVVQRGAVKCAKNGEDHYDYDQLRTVRLERGNRASRCSTHLSGTA
jgi:hypothetical protein